MIFIRDIYYKPKVQFSLFLSISRPFIIEIAKEEKEEDNLS